MDKFDPKWLASRESTEATIKAATAEHHSQHKERVVLSPSQHEALGRAAARGTLSLYGMRMATLNVLKSNGFVAQEHAIREESERELKRGDRDEFIQRAKDLLASGDWKHAHAALEFALGCSAMNASLWGSRTRPRLGLDLRFLTGVRARFCFGRIPLISD